MITERTISIHVEHYDHGCLVSASIHCGQQLPTFLTTEANGSSETMVHLNST
jgi:hypothetical protein